MDIVDGSEVLLTYAGIQSATPQQIEIAKNISTALGGLPLALAQMGGFIAERKLPLSDFLLLYLRNPVKILAKGQLQDNYGHTISTVWQSSLQNLEGRELVLLGLLSFFKPDSVSEELLREGSKVLRDARFTFLQDELE